MVVRSYRLRVVPPLLTVLLFLHLPSGAWSQEDEPDAGPLDGVEAELRAQAEVALVTRYYGIYYGNTRLGQTVEHGEIIATSEGPMLKTSQAHSGRYTLDGFSHTMKETLIEGFSLHGDGPFRFAEFEERGTTNGKGDEIHIRVETVEGALAIDIELNETKSEKKAATSGETLRTWIEFRKWLNEDREPGDTYENAYFSMSNVLRGETNVDMAETYRFEGQVEVIWNGSTHKAFEVSWKDEDGDEAQSVLLADGTRFSSSVGRMRWQREIAPDPGEVPVADLSGIGDLPSDRVITRADDIESLTVRVVTNEEIRIPNTPRQRVAHVDDRGTLIVLEQTPEDGPSEAISEKEIGDFTRATPYVQSESDAILSMANAITEDEDDVMAKAGALCSWIHRNIEYDSAHDSSSALEVFTTLRGDCSEATVLFIAFARSLGIPAREVGGFVYTDHKNSWGGHAWAEVYDGSRWVPVDPTWDQVGLGVDHILVDREPRLTGEMYRLEGATIEVVSVEYDSIASWYLSQEVDRRVSHVLVALLVMIAVVITATVLVVRRRRSPPESGPRLRLRTIVLAELYAFAVILVNGVGFAVIGDQFEYASVDWFWLPVLFAPPLAALVTAVPLSLARGLGFRATFYRTLAFFLWLLTPLAWLGSGAIAVGALIFGGPS